MCKCFMCVFCCYTEKADNLDSANVTIRNDTDNQIHIYWFDPPAPNGLIVTYDIEYKLVTADVSE